MKKGGADFAILHCVSAYPTEKKDTNLNAIRTLLGAYKVPIGFSDHTLDIDASVYAIALGARIIEKHFTLDRKMDGPDQALSANPQEFARMVGKIREVETMLGSGAIVMSKVEKGSRVFRRPSKV